MRMSILPGVLLLISMWLPRAFPLEVDNLVDSSTSMERKSHRREQLVINLGEFNSDSRCHAAMVNNDLNPTNGSLNKEEFVGFVADLAPSRAASMPGKVIDPSTTTYDDLSQVFQLAFRHIACLCTRPVFGGNATDLQCCTGSNSKIRIPVDPTSENPLPSQEDQAYLSAMCSLMNSAWSSHLKDTSQPTNVPIDPSTQAPTATLTGRPTTSVPTFKPITSAPTFKPITSVPTSGPTVRPSPLPTASPSTSHPTIPPVVTTASPTETPNQAPVLAPTPQPQQPKPQIEIREAFVSFKIAITNENMDSTNADEAIRDSLSDVTAAMNILSPEVGEETFGEGSTTIALALLAEENKNRQRKLALHKLDTSPSELMTTPENEIQHHRRLAVTVRLPTSIVSADSIGKFILLSIRQVYCTSAC